MESRALGKGLSALIPEKGAVNADAQVSYINTSLIKDNPVQPRINYDDEKLNELKASIKEKGILQPILVRKKGDMYEVVAGERRLRAARSLNLDSVPAIIKDLTDKEALVVALIENIQREELNPIEEAQAFKKLIEEFEYTHDYVAQSVGKDRSTITNFLRLLNLPVDIQKSVSEGKISMGHARALLSVESQADQKLLFIETVTRGLSVRELEKMVKDPSAVKVKSKKAKTAAKNHEIAFLEEELQKILATKVSVVAKKNKGKIIIEYYSLDELDRILETIRK